MADSGPLTRFFSVLRPSTAASPSSFFLLCEWQGLRATGQKLYGALLAAPRFLLSRQTCRLRSRSSFRDTLRPFCCIHLLHHCKARTLCVASESESSPTSYARRKLGERSCCVGKTHTCVAAVV